MIAALLAAAAVATAPAPPAAPPPQMRQLVISADDLDFMGRFLDHYAGEGCQIHTNDGIAACTAAVRAMDVWRKLQASTPVEPAKSK